MRTGMRIGWAMALTMACSTTGTGSILGGGPVDGSAGTSATGEGGTGTNVPVGGSAGTDAASRYEVTSLAVLAADREVTLTWTDPVGDATLASIEVTTLGQPESTTVAMGVGTVTISGLLNQTQYTFIVRTVDSSGAKSPGVAVSARADFVKVEGGTFQQGTADSTIKPSYPPHSVTLASYYIGKYEVTYTEFDEFADVTGRPLPLDRGWGRGARPVQNVSWFTAVAYANWRSQKEGLQPVYTIDQQTPDPHNVSGEAINMTVTANWDASGYRLPTEAEWEFAAIGGNLTHGYKFSGSDAVIDIGWTGADTAAGINGAASTHPVGTKQPNELGVYDFTGNVNEFTWDPALSTNQNNYTADAQTNPRGPEGDYDRRVVRGGGPHSAVTCSANVIRHFLLPSRECMVGIRLARSVKGGAP